MMRLFLFSFFTCLLAFSFLSSNGQKSTVPEMVKVEGGTFLMGCEEIREPEDTTGLPYHLVSLKSFSIAKTETTVGQWKAYCNATGTRMPIEPAWGWVDNHPIVNVSWDEISAYCLWLNKQTGKKYRLPTEAEWEYAARGGNKSKGFLFAGGQAPYMYSWFEENSNSTSQPVGKKRPNELGLYDMSGNAWEWCLDWWGPYSEGKKINPQGKEEGYFKVIRGGSWNYSFNDCRTGARDFFSPDGRHNDFGFRLVLEESVASTGN